MTVATTGREAANLTNGVTRAFPVKFKVLLSTDLVVSLETIATGAAVPLTEGVDYTITGSLVAGLATVLTTVAYPVGFRLRRRRATARTQPLNLVPNDGAPAGAQEDAYDRAILISQEQDADHADTTSRALLVPPGEVAALLPPAAQRTGGNKIIAPDPITGAITVLNGDYFVGAPGGNVMAAALFIGTIGMDVPAGTMMVRTTGWSTPGKGAAFYAYDPTVGAAFIAAHPRSSFIAADGRGFRIAETVKTPAMYGAIGDASRYVLGVGAVNDTLAIAALWADLQVGDTWRCDDTHLFDGAKLIDGGFYLGQTLSQDKIIVEGNGSLIQPRGEDTVLLPIIGNNVTVRNLTLQGFNGSFNATVSGTSLIITGQLVGTIRYYTNVQGRFGTPLFGEGITEGTRIVGFADGVYVLDRPQEAAWAGPVLFMDVLQFNSHNDSMRIGITGAEGKDCTFEATTVLGSAGTSYVTVAEGTKGIRPVSKAAHDNGYLAASKFAGGYLFDNPVSRGTGRQNGGLGTASADSSATDDVILGGTWINPTFSNSGDSPIELGVNSEGAKIEGGTLGPSVAPSVLLRDTNGCRVAGPIECIPQQGALAEWSPIAVVQQHKPASWNCRAIVAGVRYKGEQPRGFAYLQQSGIILEDCHGDTEPVAIDGSDLEGFFVTLAGPVTDIEIRKCSGVGYLGNINYNFGAAPITIQRVVIKDSNFDQCGSHLAGFNVNFVQCRSTGNVINIVRNNPYNLVNATYTVVNNIPGLIVDDVINREGFTVTANHDFAPSTAAANGVAVNRNTKELSLPEVQFDATVIGPMSEVANKTVRVLIVGLNEDASFATSVAAQTTAKTVGSANLVGTAGASDFTGWAIAAVSGQLVNQRRGPNTNLVGRTFQRSLT